MKPYFLAILALQTVDLAFAQAPPEGMRVSTWVREDIFAGFLVGDMDRFGVGMQKVRDTLARNPKAADALAWRGGGELLLAVRAHEQGQPEVFGQWFARAKASFAEAAGAGNSPDAAQAVHAIAGGSFVVFSDRLPAAHRREGWEAVRTHYSALRELQKPSFDKLPVHFRGEVIAGLAMAAQRLESDDASLRLREVTEALAGTVYAARAKRWMDNPASISTSSISCQTCHDPGKLANVRPAQPKP